MERLGLSARVYDRILKASDTIALLSASEKIRIGRLAEAIGYQNMDRENWMVQVGEVNKVIYGEFCFTKRSIDNRLFLKLGA